LWIVGYQRPGRLLLVKPKEEASLARTRADGRRQLLLYLSPDIIKDLKRAALDAEVPAYELAEVAIREFLRGRKRKK
jgi:hypothetical protein